MKCWSEEALDKLPSIPFIFFDRNLDGVYESCGIIESVNEDGTITVTESNEEFNRTLERNKNESN